eukprot:scaffold10597_cov124-Isochrysis_galbana.AAC.12
MRESARRPRVSATEQNARELEHERRVQPFRLRQRLSRQFGGQVRSNGAGSISGGREIGERACSACDM